LIDDYINFLSVNPRKIFGITIPQIQEGATACLTLFNFDEEYIFDEKMIQSKSKNSAFIGKTLKGKVLGIINKEKVVLNKA
jgi:dihydroorotase